MDRRKKTYEQMNNICCMKSSLEVNVGKVDKHNLLILFSKRQQDKELYVHPRN